MAKKRAQKRYFAQERHPRHIVTVVGRVNTADRHRPAVFHLDPRLHMFGVDRRPRIGLLADTIFRHVEVQDHPAIGRNLRFDLQFERRAAKLHAGDALPDLGLSIELRRVEAIDPATAPVWLAAALAAPVAE